MRDDIPHRRGTDIEYRIKHTRSLVIECKHKLIILKYYKLPTIDNKYFVKSLDAICHYGVNESSDIIIMGDFNIYIYDGCYMRYM